MKQLLNKIKAKIEPGHSLKKEVAVVLKKINDCLQKLQINAVAVVGGSFAKNTNLKDDFDVDVFVKFGFNEYKGRDDELSGILEKILKQLKPVRVHGSRDYFQIKGKLNLEVVPVLDVKKPELAQNVTDMSPLHVEWVKKHLGKDRKLADEIRLAKQFCKAHDCYGAESYIKGFSGHVLDILVIHYGGFENLLKASVKWKTGRAVGKSRKAGRAKDVIDIYNVHKGNALFNLNASKIHSPIVVVDPVFPDRNAAAALGEDKLNAFVDAAKRFLKNPSEKFFERKEINEKILKKKIKQGKNNKLILLNVKSKKGKEDIIGSKLLKAFEYIEKSITANDFSLIDSGWSWDKKTKAVFYYICKKETLVKTKIVKGPPTKQRFHSKNFMKKHKKTFVKEGWLYAEVKRKFVKVEDLIRVLIKETYVVEKVKEIK